MLGWIFGVLTAYVGYLVARALITGRVPAGRTLTKVHYAERDGSPILFWFFTLVHVAILIMVGSALAHTLNPAMPSLVDLI